jgi:NADPH2:quinone reductase
MKAVWYERNGPARDVLTFGAISDPAPGPNQVRVRVQWVGVNPADVKRRAGVGGRFLSDQRVIPGDDGAGVIDMVGDGVAESRLGQRVWVRFANQRSPFGTSAEYVTVPTVHAVALPEGVPIEVGACLGVPLLTAYRSLSTDGPVTGTNILVTGAAGAVGNYVVQLAARAGASVIATASTADKHLTAREAGAEHVLNYREPGVAERVLELTNGRGVDRVIDCAFGANLPLTRRVVAEGGTIVAYGSDAEPEPALPFYPLMRLGVTIHLLSVFRMPSDALRLGTDAITDLLADGALTHRIAARIPLADAAEAHLLVEAGRVIGKTLLEIA